MLETFDIQVEYLLYGMPGYVCTRLFSLIPLGRESQGSAFSDETSRILLLATFWDRFVHLSARIFALCGLNSRVGWCFVDLPYGVLVRT